jgi:hypothetical protein
LERVVFSLGVPPQSFKATDLVVIADRIRPEGGSKKLRRITEIVEVGKSWREPDAEKVFAPLMAYDQEKDLLVAGERLKKPEKSEVIRKIAGRRGVRPRTILADIEARASAYSRAVELFKISGDRKLLSLKMMAALNQKYSQLVDEGIKESGKADYDFVAEKILEWLEGCSSGRVKIEILAKDGLRKGMQEVGQPA